MSVAFDSDVDVLVEIAFDSDPFAESPSFTDISQFVRSFNTSRGRINELGQFGSVQVDLLKEKFQLKKDTDTKAS